MVSSYFTVTNFSDMLTVMLIGSVKLSVYTIYVPANSDNFPYASYIGRHHVTECLLMLWCYIKGVVDIDVVSSYFTVTNFSDMLTVMLIGSVKLSVYTIYVPANFNNFPYASYIGPHYVTGCLTYAVVLD